MSAVRWWELTSNVSTLWHWLEAHDMAPSNPSHFLSKPWNWTREWKEMQAEGGGLAEGLEASLVYARLGTPRREV